MAAFDNIVARPGQSVTIRKLSAAGAVVFAYPGVVVAMLAGGVRLEAQWTRGAMKLGYVTFEPGDQFSEWFYTDRWYNIMEVRAPSGALKGWYCNIGWPATVGNGIVSYRDLILDLWVAPNGSALALDEQEFAEDTTLTVEERAGALDGMRRLCAHLERREAPFNILGAGGQLADEREV